MTNTKPAPKRSTQNPGKNKDGSFNLTIEFFSALAIHIANRGGKKISMQRIPTMGAAKNAAGIEATSIRATASLTVAEHSFKKDGFIHKAIEAFDTHYDAKNAAIRDAIPAHKDDANSKVEGEKAIAPTPPTKPVASAVDNLTNVDKRKTIDRAAFIRPLVNYNPRRIGTHGNTSMSIILVNTKTVPFVTVEKYLKEGGRPRDLSYDIEKGHVELVKFSKEGEAPADAAKVKSLEIKQEPKKEVANEKAPE